MRGPPANGIKTRLDVLNAALGRRPILVVENDDVDYELIRTSLLKAGFEVERDRTVGAAIDRLTRLPLPSGIIVEYDLPDGTAEDLIEAAPSGMRIVVCSGHPRRQGISKSEDGWRDKIVAAVDALSGRVLEVDPDEGLIEAIEGLRKEARRRIG